MLACAVLALAGCGNDDASDDPGAGAAGGDIATTPQALAAVAAEYAPDPSSASAETDAAEEFRRGGVGAELRYGSDGEYDGDALTLAVGDGLPKQLKSCETAPDYVGQCVEMAGGLLFWEEEAPEEDPGVVYVVVPKGDASALMFYSGPKITGDPRELDLPIDVDTLFDIANDPRVDVTTSQAAVDAGAALDFWRD